RIGSDEFAILKTTFQGEPDFLTAKDLLSIINQPYPNISANFPVTASIGISVYPTDEHSLDQNICDQLIANAYTGLQKAKAKGNNNYEFYSDGMTAAVQKRLKLTNDLRSALENNQLFLHYQPRVDWRSGEMVGAECLVRWQHPELGTMLPAEFIPIAEETGLILPISEWLLKTACQQNKVWQRSGLKPFTVAVNLSARQIEQSNLADFVRRTLEETDLAPEFLELEVTESLLIGNIEHTLSVLTALHNQGVVLALDDFGTGYSSLSYLRRFPFDVLKIDRSFVRDMVHSADVAAITKAVGALAQGLQLGLVAEGVETEEQLNQIKTYGCHEIQGYYFSRPLSVAALSQLLRGPNPWQDKTLSGNSLPHRDSLSSRDSLPTVIHHSV
ncbi:MAG: bifunctional diguanylate cyclase/phosphodiesterase, partial [Phormidesmis sp.]